MAALLKATQAQDWAGELGARLACVISNRADAAGLALAKEAGVATQVLEHRAFDSREAFDSALAKVIDGYEPALIVLAGFMRVLSLPFVQRYVGRLINIHPSLLPALPGLATHRQALDAGVRVHGATVHYVSAQVDGGAIIGQALVRIRQGDTESTLAARVLAQEHILLPRCVRFILENRVGWHPVGGADASVGRVWCAPEVADQLLVMP